MRGLVFGLCLVLLTKCLLVDCLVLPRRGRNHDISGSVTSQLEGSSSPLFLFTVSSLDTSYADDDDDDENHPNESIQIKYKSISLIYAVLAAILWIMPDRTMTKRLATKFGGAAGYGVAAAVAKLLSNQQLDQSTRKHLSLGLSGFSLLGLLAFPGEAGFLNKAGSAMVLAGSMNAAKLWGSLVSFSVSGILDKPKKALGDFCNVAFSSLKGLKVTQAAKKRSLTYRNCLLLVMASMGSCLMEGVFYVRYFGSAVGKSLFDISLQWSAVARLFLISSVIYSLKDLADRDQMTTGTTFIQLNLMVGAWAVLVGLGQGLTLTGYSNKRGLEMIALSLLFFAKGLKYAKFRSDEMSNPRLEPPTAEYIESQQQPE